MNRVKAANSVAFAARDIAPLTGTAQYFTNGNPATPTPATVFPGYWANMVQDEIIAVISAASLTPSDTNWGQLLAAIQALIAVEATARAALFGTCFSRTVSGGSPFRVLGTTYTNSTGRPMMVFATGLTSSTSSNLNMIVGGATIFSFGQPTNASLTSCCGLVPAGATYAVTNTVAGITLQSWTEVY